MSVLIFGDSDIGKKRTNNEDSYLCYSLGDFSEPHYLIAVADGMGGHRGGEIASALAIESIKKRLIDQFKERTALDSNFIDILEDSVQQANSKVYSEAAQSNDLTGMGSTLVAALLSQGQAVVCNVGDSRAYLIRQKQIDQITTDHNWKSEQLQLGELDEDDIKGSPYKDLITRSLGLNEETEIDSFPVDVHPEDYLLLCSDGLHSLVTNKEILKTFRKHKNPEAICHKLIEAANKKGGHDNITVIVALFTEQEPIDG